MKYLKYLLFITVVISSCKTKKYQINAPVIAKKMNANKVSRKHIAADFNKKTVDAKLNVVFKNNRENQSFSLQLKIEKDKTIWLKGSKVISIFKAKITPNSVQYYSPYAKNYFEGDFSMLKNLLGVDINFNQLQNLLLGQAMAELDQEKQPAKIIDNLYELTPKIESPLLTSLFYINPLHFKLSKQSFTRLEKNQKLDILYPEYLEKEHELFPKNIVINAQKGEKFTHIEMSVRSVIFDTDLNMPFTIPTGYKKLTF
ncbi:DUF4292 domain-containing protein [Tenacibaculum sp. UWU-22]|uniref:DUF4292 domain-containing protein n=1 Tax=Tenacibaculum sp. UWU-22 TaxID=3234187 RepID=UPI0034DB4AAA